jgi:hypothetical protein
MDAEQSGSGSPTSNYGNFGATSGNFGATSGNFGATSGNFGDGEVWYEVAKLKNRKSLMESSG